MNLGMRNGALDCPHLCDIGDNEGICARGIGLTHKVQRGHELMFAQVDIACHVHTHTMCMRQAHRARKLDGLDIFRTRAGVEGAKPAVDGIGTRGNSRKERIDRARRGQKLW